LARLCSQHGRPARRSPTFVIEAMGATVSTVAGCECGRGRDKDGGTPGSKIQLASAITGHVFELGFSSLGAPGAKAVAAMLPRHHLVTACSLRYNSMGDAGCRAILHALPKTNIEDLDLRGNGMGPASMKELVAVLPKSKVRILRLSNNDIGDEGVRLLAEGLAGLKLVVLHIACNGISGVGAKALAEVLPECTNLKELGLENNSFGIEGVMALAEVLPRSTLCKIDLRKTGINDKANEALQEVSRGLKGALRIKGLNHGTPRLEE